MGLVLTKPHHMLHYCIKPDHQRLRTRDFRGTVLRLLPSTREISASGKRSRRCAAICSAFSMERRPFLVMTVTTGYSWGSFTSSPKLAIAAAQKVDVLTRASEAWVTAQSAISHLLSITLALLAPASCRWVHTRQAQTPDGSIKAAAAKLFDSTTMEVPLRLIARRCGIFRG